MGKRVIPSLASLYVVIMLWVRGLQRNRCQWWDTEAHAHRQGLF